MPPALTTATLSNELNRDAIRLWPANEDREPRRIAAFPPAFSSSPITDNPVGGMRAPRPRSPSTAVDPALAELVVKSTCHSRPAGVCTRSKAFSSHHSTRRRGGGGGGGVGGVGGPPPPPPHRAPPPPHANPLGRPPDARSNANERRAL
jgi:hypothetical protein